MSLRGMVKKLKSDIHKLFHRDFYKTLYMAMRSGVGMMYKDVNFSSTARVKRALTNAILMFFVVSGTTVLFTETFEIECNNTMLTLCFAAFSLFFSLINCKRAYQNIGYILFFAAFTLFVLNYRSFLNSGLNGVLNDFFEYASDQWDMSVTKNYSEAFKDQHYMTVTVFLITVGLAVELFINFIFNNEQSPLTMFIVMLPFLAFCMYFDETANALAAWLIITVLLCCFVFRHNYQFFMPTAKKTFIRRHFFKDHIFIQYSSGRTTLQIFGVTACFMILVSLFANIICPQSSYTPSQSLTALKESTEDTVRQVLLYGVQSLFNDNSSNRGIQNGSLGTADTVYQDFETDLVVTFAPYSYETVYLKEWVGDTYTGSSWEQQIVPGSDQLSDEEILAGFENKEALNLSELMETDSRVLKGKMQVEAVDSSLGISFLAYPDYTLFDDDLFTFLYDGGLNPPSYLGLDRTKTFEYYVYQDIWSSSYADMDASDEYDYFVSDNYTSVPEDIAAQLESLCAELGFGGSTAEIISQIQNFLSENYTYTLNPGKTPSGKDFVTYFLFEHPYGYCTYFATAGTLLLRSMGIPARYVEGYALSMDEVVDADILTDEKYEDWLSGSADIGKTAVVSASLTDACAHAWCEVYLNGFGWVPVEFTTASSENEDDKNYSALWNLLSGGDASQETTDALAAIAGVNLDGFFTAAGRILAAVFAAAVLFVAYRLIKNHLQKKNAVFYTGNSAKIMKEYQNLCRFICRLGLCESENMTVTELENILIKVPALKEQELSELISIYKDCAYSPDEADETCARHFRRLCGLAKRAIRRARIKSV